MKYLRKFENEAAYEAYKESEDWITPNVSLCTGENTVKYEPFIPLPPHGYSQDYLTIVSASDNNVIGWKVSDVSEAKTISVSTDNGSTWTDVTSTTSGATLATLNTGDKLLIKGSNTAYGISSNYNYFTSSDQFNVEGNIMSLLYGDNFEDQATLSSNYTFENLFYNSKIVNACNLILPATTLANSCYSSMFQGCTSLVTAPELPATTLAFGCYQIMFRDCTSLVTVTAPELPATTLANNCYLSMFDGCTSLVTAPELPATTLAQGCYSKMFDGCTSLVTAPELPATTLAISCYSSMFYGCTSLVTAPELPATTLANSCYSNMFYGCTSLVTAPELPATTLAFGCYQIMFRDCTSLVTPATTLAQSCYYLMFYGCNNLSKITMLATNTSAFNCLSEWVKEVAATGTFIKNPAMKTLPTGVNGIPSGWTVEDAS